MHSLSPINWRSDCVLPPAVEGHLCPWAGGVLVSLVLSSCCPGFGLGSGLHLLSSSSFCFCPGTLKRCLLSQVLHPSPQVLSHKSVGILTGFLSCALTSILPPAGLAWITSSSLLLQMEMWRLEVFAFPKPELVQKPWVSSWSWSCVFESFHACLVPALGLSGL